LQLIENIEDSLFLWLHFTGEVDKSKNAYGTSLFFRISFNKNIQSGSFLTE